jgi:hypothetical protein
MAMIGNWKSRRHREFPCLPVRVRIWNFRRQGDISGSILEGSRNTRAVPLSFAAFSPPFARKKRRMGTRHILDECLDYALIEIRHAQ